VTRLQLRREPERTIAVVAELHRRAAAREAAPARAAAAR
jgi:hypothetical protein